MGYRLINPYTIYVGSFSTALLLYLLRWSDYYPAIQWPLFLFLIISFGVSIYLAWRQFNQTITTIKSPAVNTISAGVITLILYVLWGIEFLYADGVPLIWILLGKPFNYRTFGVPSLHVFIVTFSSFYTCYLYHAYLASKKKILLTFCVLNLIAALLIMNRGMLLTNLSSMFFVYWLTRKSMKNVLSTKIVALLVVSTLGLFFLFGMLGTLRVSREIQHLYSRSLVYEVGNATTSFKESIIPSEFFWGYLYITSPLANLQHNIERSHPEINVDNFFLLMNNEFLPDAVSKRITTTCKLSEKENLQIAENLNASTVFSGSYTYWGWGGLVIMFSFLMLIPLLIRFLGLEETPYLITFLSILNSLYLFLIFDNMIAFTGFSFQLVYPIILGFLHKKFRS